MSVCTVYANDVSRSENIIDMKIQLINLQLITNKERSKANVQLISNNRIVKRREADESRQQLLDETRRRADKVVCTRTR